LVDFESEIADPDSVMIDAPSGPTMSHNKQQVMLWRD